MIRALPRRLSDLFAMFRGELQELTDVASSKRPLSPAVIRERLSDLIASFNALETGIIQELENDPDYLPDPWDQEDFVTLTDRRLP